VSIWPPAWRGSASGCCCRPRSAGQCNHGFGVDKRTLESSVYDVLLESATVAEARTRSEQGGYDVLGANRELAGAEIELVALEHRNERLRRALKAAEVRLRLRADRLPAVAVMLTLNGLCARTA
jgi:chromosome partitioning protein